TRQIVVIGGAKESVTVGQDFKHAFGEDVPFFFALGLEDLEDQVLLAQAAGAGQIQRSGDLGQLGYVLFFKFCDGHSSPARRFSKGGTQKGRRYFQEAGGRAVKQPAVVPR